MTTFAPFNGLRYAQDRHRLVDVTAPPYDVIDDRDRAALVARDPHNIVGIDVPDAANGAVRYEMAAATFAQWREAGDVVCDEAPSFTVYQMSYVDDAGNPAHTLGVFGALQLSDPDQGAILPHEHTTPKAKSDRLDLLRATRVNLSPIWGLSLSKGLTALLRSDSEPEEAWVDDDGVGHAFWRITESTRLDAIAASVSATPVVIADGHHRLETSQTYRAERIETDGDAGEADRTMIFIVELVDDELTVRPIHRLINGVEAEALTTALSPWFELSDAGEIGADITLRMADEGALAWVHPDGTGTFLRPREGVFEGIDDLDSSRLAAALESLDAATVNYQHGVDRVQRALADGNADHGVLLRPATVAQIERNAEVGRKMPPKTTFFHPKPRTGVVFRSID